MNASFVSTSWPPAPIDATAHHAQLPRPMRKTLRLATQRTKPTNNASALPEAVDKHWANVEYRNNADARYFQTNLETAGADAEYDDGPQTLEDECTSHGLTITAAMDEVELFRFCTGYDVL